MTEKTLPIECHNLSYKVANKALLTEVSCQFEAAQINVILGKNGAGKSTLLGLLSRELEASSGELVFSGKDIKQIDYQALAVQRAVLPQLQNLVFSISVEQLIALGAEVNFAGQKVADMQMQLAEVVQQVMQAFDLQQFAKRDVLTLSGGEQKRVQLARIVAQIWPLQTINQQHDYVFKHRWLLLDEWTNGLDIEHQQQLLKLFRQWADNGLGIVMVLHDLNLATQLADDIKLLKHGHLLFEGTPEEVMTVANIREVFDVDVQIDILPQTGKKIIVAE